jgi:hypothetical protein
MANSLLTPTVITREALRVLKNHLGFAKGVNRQYDDRFAQSGAKIGDSVTIRKPVRYTVRSGAAASVQDVTEQSVALTLENQIGVDFAFSDKDLTLTIDAFSERYIKPAVAAMVNKVDSDIAGLYKHIYHSVGTPGTTMTDLSDALGGFQKMKEAGCPVDDMSKIFINPSAEASIINGLSGKFHSSDQIKDQYEKGMMGKAAGLTWIMDQNIKQHAVGAHGGTPLINGASQSGSSLVTDGWSLSTAVLKEGDVFTIAGVYAINPQNRESTGALQQFVVGADVSSDGSGNATISISPAITTSGAYQTVSAAPADGAAITVLGTASSAYPQNLILHRDAVVLGCADLELPGGVDMAERVSDSESGLSIRFVRDYDVNNDKRISRLDMLYGIKMVYPELACRVWN